MLCQLRIGVFDVDGAGSAVRPTYHIVWRLSCGIGGLRVVVVVVVV